MSILSEMLTNKKRTVKGRSQQDVYQKLFRFATSRGFETSLVINTLKKMFKNIDDD
jgi:hypothetical protein